MAAVVCLLAVPIDVRIANAQSPELYGWWAQASVGAVGAPAPPDVPADGMYIQNLPSGPSAIAALSFATPPGTAEAQLTLVIAGAPVITQPPVACVATSRFKAAEGGAWSDKPNYDCARSVTGTVDSSQTKVTFTVGKLIRADGALDLVVLAAGPTDRVAFTKPDAQTLQTTTTATTPPSSTGGAGPPPGTEAPSSQPATAPAPAALPPTAATAATQGAPAPVVATAPGGAPQAAANGNPTVQPPSHSLRTQLGEMLGVTLLLLCLLYWTDGFGAVPLRSALIRRTRARAA
jgi:hypothetical protein